MENAGVYVDTSIDDQNLLLGNEFQVLSFSRCLFPGLCVSLSHRKAINTHINTDHHK